MPSLSIAQIVTFIVPIIAYFSFIYGRKPLIHVKINKNTDYEFIINNVSKNPAKNIIAEVKLDYKGKIEDIDKYKFNYLMPEAEEVIKIFEKTESKLEHLKLLLKSPYEWPINPESYFCMGRIDEQINFIGNSKKDELETLHDSHKIDNNFKISINFKVTCNADMPLEKIPLFNKLFNNHKFLYKFNISYTKHDLDYLKDIDQETHLKILYGCMNNYYLIIRPITDF